MSLSPTFLMAYCVLLLEPLLAGLQSNPIPDGSFLGKKAASDPGLSHCR